MKHWALCTSPEPDSPTDLRFTDITENSALVIWSAPQAKVTGYSIFITTEGSATKQLRVPAHESQYTITSLRPDTDYIVVLHAEQDGTLSEGIRGTFTTCELQAMLMNRRLENVASAD